MQLSWRSHVTFTHLRPVGRVCFIIIWPGVQCTCRISPTNHCRRFWSYPGARWSLIPVVYLVCFAVYLLGNNRMGILTQMALCVDANTVSLSGRQVVIYHGITHRQRAAHSNAYDKGFYASLYSSSISTVLITLLVVILKSLASRLTWVDDFPLILTMERTDASGYIAPFSLKNKAEVETSRCLYIGQCLYL
ncbi:hypothetical protein F4825DRAFT_299763 [Nemania diffusa]|nr:hypothetical protein F4825DRAFT_299763 [Nemania diffusa]